MRRKNTLRFATCMFLGLFAFSTNTNSAELVKPIDPPKTVSVLTATPYKNDDHFIDWNNVRTLYEHLQSKGVKKKHLFVVMPENDVTYVRQNYLMGDKLQASNASYLSRQGLEKLLSKLYKTVDSNDTLIFYFAGDLNKSGSKKVIGQDIDVDYLKRFLGKLDYQKAIIVIDAENADSFGALKSDRNIVVISGGKYLHDQFSSFGKMFLFNLSDGFADLNEDGKVTCNESFEASTKKHYNYMNSRYGINILFKGRKIIESKIFLESDMALYVKVKKKKINSNNLRDLLEKLSYRYYDVHDNILQKYIAPYIKIPYASGIFFHWRGKDKFIQENKDKFRKIYESDKKIKNKMGFDDFLRNLYFGFGGRYSEAMCAALPENFGKNYKPVILVFDNFFDNEGIVTLDDARCLLQDHEHKHAKDVFFGLSYKGVNVDVSTLPRDIFVAIMEVRAEEKELKGVRSGKWKNLSNEFIGKSEADFIYRFTSLQDMLKDSKISSFHKDLIRTQIEELSYEVYEENNELKIRKKIQQ